MEAKLQGDGYQERRGQCRTTSDIAPAGYLDRPLGVLDHYASSEVLPDWLVVGSRHLCCLGDLVEVGTRVLSQLGVERVVVRVVAAEVTLLLEPRILHLVEIHGTSPCKGLSWF